MSSRPTHRHSPGAAIRRAIGGMVLAAALAVAALLLPASAGAFGFQSFEAPVQNQADEFETQAGVAPYKVMNSMMFDTTTNTAGNTVPDGNIKNMTVDLPAGFVGNPTAVAECDPALVMNFGANGCPAATQVGMMILHLQYPTYAIDLPTPVFNVRTPQGAPAQFGFRAVTVPVYMTASVRPEDNGISVSLDYVSQALPLVGTKLELWGVPPAHTTSGAEKKPFLVNPTDCSAGPLTTTVRGNSWQDPDHTATATYDNPAVTGCDKLDFRPTVKVQPESKATDTPSGYHVELGLPQDDSPTGLATANLKRAEVALPEGTAVNPAAADGLDSCSPNEIALGEDADADCPEASKIGQVTIDTPLMPEPMKGGIYQAEQDNNPFDSTLAIYLVPDSDRYGVQLKLPGEIATDPETGQLTTTFDDNPKLPFSKLTLDFNDGSRAPLVNPPTCGTKTVSGELSPWSAADPDNPTPDELVTSTDSFQITSGPKGSDCANTLADRGFDPEMKSGLVNPVAASSSPFVLKLTRPDGSQELDTLTVSPPEGVTSVLKSADQCSDSDIAANDCPESSKIGSTTVGVGAGNSPYYVQGGEVYLAGPYKGAPLSLDIEVPAIAGPFDLGIVNVRSAIEVDKRTAQLTIKSDPLPQILEGIPLRIKDLRVKIDRPGFMLAPTNCNPMSVEATVNGINGAEADLANRFQVGECANLDFSPKLNLQYKGKGSKKRNAHPRLAANLKIPQPAANFDSDIANDTTKQANLDKVRVVLPRGTFLDQDALSRVCTPTQWEAESCPEDSKIGNAKAWSPILDEPLKGPVYLKVGPNELPDIAADLDGIVDIDLLGKIDQSKGRIRNTFQVVPDVPVSRFRMNISGGNGGLLVNSKDICKGKKALRRANVTMKGQNGAKLRGKQNVVRCGGKRR